MTSRDAYSIEVILLCMHIILILILIALAYIAGKMK
jgi:hypothetical protein